MEPVLCFRRFPTGDKIINGAAFFPIQQILKSIIVLITLLPAVKFLSRKGLCKENRRWSNCFLLMFYPPKGLCKADTEGGPIVFTYVLFCVRKRILDSQFTSGFFCLFETSPMFYLVGQRYRFFFFTRKSSFFCIFEDFRMNE